MQLDHIHYRDGWAPLALTITAASLLFACGGERDDVRSSRGGEQGTANGTISSPDHLPGSGGARSKNTEHGSMEEGSPKPAGSIEGNSPTNPMAVAGRAYFADTIIPIFDDQCAGCHAAPRVAVPSRGPLSIFNYEAMQALLAKGASAEQNDLLDKVRGGTPHGGGNRCSVGSGPNQVGDLSLSPCRQLVDWWRQEFGDARKSATLLGEIYEVSALGRVRGYAFDPADPDRAVSVRLYSSDQAIATVTANQAGDDRGSPGNHAFTFDLPSEYRDGSVRELTLEADSAAGTVTLGNAKSYQAWGFSEAGRAYYNSSVRGALNGCAGCHELNYEQQFYSLIAPSPAGGGSPADNQLFNKPAEANGVNHGGGRRCANEDAAPCRQIKEWWTIEFGN